LINTRIKEAIEQSVTAITLHVWLESLPEYGQFTIMTSRPASLRYLSDTGSALNEMQVSSQMEPYVTWQIGVAVQMSLGQAGCGWKWLRPTRITGRLCRVTPSSTFRGHVFRQSALVAAAFLVRRRPN
jgi:hypothetical protein